MTSYYNDSNKNLTTYVNYSLLGENDQEFNTKTNAGCFSSITYTNLPPKTKKILVFHPLNSIPYTWEIIERWIRQINRLGFPCELRLSEDKNNMEVLIDLKNYEYKIHVTLTLQLIRYLTETDICKIPEKYFQKLDGIKLNDENKKITKNERFVILQEIHKGSEGNANHKLTSPGGGYYDCKIISRERLFENIAATKKGVYENCMGVNALFK